MFETIDQPDSLYESIYLLEDFINDHFNECDPKYREEVDDILENLKDDVREATTSNQFNYMVTIAHNKVVDIFNRYVDITQPPSQ